MKKNLGKTDRIIRVVLAVIMVALYFTGTVSGVLGMVLLVLGLVFLLTSLIGVCPLYLPFKFSTNK